MSDLVLRGLAKAFGATRVLRGVDLEVAEGSLTAVLGPSGCGKTTLLRVVAGFVAPDGGTVSAGGRVLAGPGVMVPAERRRIGMVPQEGALFPHLTVSGNVAFGLPRAGGRQARAARVEEMLELVGLRGYGDRMPFELSGGQQQRVALARALAPSPGLVLLDEPFSSLDTGLRGALREDVRAALRSTGATAVLVTHDQQEALSLADSVAVMRAGRVVQVGSPAAIYSSPADLEVATFVGEAVILSAVVSGGRASTVLGVLELTSPATDGDRGYVAVRPEQLVMSAGSGVGATVRQATFFGHDALITLDLERPGPTGDVVTVRTTAALVPTTGTGVRVSVNTPVVFFANHSGAGHREAVS